jgi:hypothetical protein
MGSGWDKKKKKGGRERERPSNNNMHSIAATDSSNTFHSLIQFSDVISHASITFISMV